MIFPSEPADRSLHPPPGHAYLPFGSLAGAYILYDSIYDPRREASHEAAAFPAISGSRNVMRRVAVLFANLERVENRGKYGKAHAGPDFRREPADEQGFKSPCYVAACGFAEPRGDPSG